jgi:hypothetical protein
MIVKPDFTLDEISDIILQEIKLHPRCHYLDVFKLLYQAFYGPSHIEPQRDTIIYNLKRELNDMKWKTDVPYQDIGVGKGFIRLNLISIISLPDEDLKQNSMLLNKKIPTEYLKDSEDKIKILADCILQSRFENEINWNDWIQTWENSIPLVKSIIPPTAEEDLMIEDCLTKKIMPTHSEEYRQWYDPHYRVIHYSLLRFIF